jgi:uncharacterized protein YndB with AHSA1/START domain
MALDKDVATVERFIPAPASKIFDLLADPDRHKDIDGSGTVQQATTGSTRLALGSTFGMSMRMGIGYSMESTVIEFEEDRRIAWQTRPPNKVAAVFAGGRIWRYELEPVAGGTNVRESWDITQEQQKWFVRPARQKTVAAMEKTLARIEELVTVPEA